MTLSKTILMSAALVGATVLSTPVWAQASGSAADTSMKTNAAAKTDTTMAPMASTAKSSDPAMAMPATPSTTASNIDAAAAAGASTTAQAPQVAMNTSGSASDVSGVGDTSTKYVRSHRAKDFDAEAKVTAQLNQKAAATAAPSGATVQ